MLKVSYKWKQALLGSVSIILFPNSFKELLALSSMENANEPSA